MNSSDVVRKHAKMNICSTWDVKPLLDLEDTPNTNSAANTYWAALRIIKEDTSRIVELEHDIDELRSILLEALPYLLDGTGDGGKLHSRAVELLERD